MISRRAWGRASTSSRFSLHPVGGHRAHLALRGREDEQRLGRDGGAGHGSGEGGVDIHFDCWAIQSDYIYRFGQDNEFRISVNLLGVGQAATSARGLGF
jgi:hypothetical protein